MIELFNLFEEIGLPYFRQGSLTDENYEPSFFTFWNFDTQNSSFYDNEEHRYIEYVQVCFYTNDAILIYTIMDYFIEKAKEHGFEISGKARDTSSDKYGYFGRLVNIKIIH